MRIYQLCIHNPDAPPASRISRGLAVKHPRGTFYISAHTARAIWEAVQTFADESDFLCGDSGDPSPLDFGTIQETPGDDITYGDDFPKYRPAVDPSEEQLSLQELEDLAVARMEREHNERAAHHPNGWRNVP